MTVSVDREDEAADLAEATVAMSAHTTVAHLQGIRAHRRRDAEISTATCRALAVAEKTTHADAAAHLHTAGPLRDPPLHQDNADVTTPLLIARAPEADHQAVMPSEIVQDDALLGDDLPTLMIHAHPLTGVVVVETRIHAPDLRRADHAILALTQIHAPRHQSVKASSQLMTSCQRAIATRTTTDSAAKAPRTAARQRAADALRAMTSLQTVVPKTRWVMTNDESFPDLGIDITAYKHQPEMMS